MATAGVDARARLLDALCESDVNHVIPKRGALTLPRGGMPVLGSLEGPDEHDLFAAVRRLLDGPESPGVTPYLLAGAPVHEVSVRSSQDKDRALESIVAFGESMGLTGEKLRRVELAAEELLMNALYDAPRNADGRARNAELDRRHAGQRSAPTRRCTCATAATGRRWRSPSPIRSARSRRRRSPTACARCATASPSRTPASPAPASAW